MKFLNNIFKLKVLKMCLDSILTISKTNELTNCDYQKRDITPTNQPTTKF